MTAMKDPRGYTPVAIVGLAGRFPGASSVAEFWRNLMQGVESIRFASTQELAQAHVDPALIANPDYVPASSPIAQPEYFDAAFFHYSAREAEIIDPQQRLFLECAWQALEDAACDPSTFPGSIGLFAGAGMNTYALTNIFSNPAVIASVGPYQVMIANDKDFLSSRVAYKLNLRGPAVGVQTACSTSLVAVQMAFESLLRRECDVALAGGVSLNLPQSPGYLHAPGMIHSRDGHCRAFDAEASGTVPGSGVGVAVLKRLEDALADGDHIYAVIHGAAINNDGSLKVGYTAPGVDGQAAAIQRSMQMAGFAPESVAYVEAHGTGTEVGDPIEVAALQKAFASGDNRPGACVLGAVKTNIGHLDTAAGIAGLIKAALSLQHRVVPPTLHFQRPNPLIDFSSTPFYVSAAPVLYDREAPFRAGVSSFGIGGTNAHVSLEEPPPARSDPPNGSQLVVLSAKTASALENQSAQLADFLAENPAVNLADLAFTLQKGRQAFSHRRVIVAQTAHQLRAELLLPRSHAGQQKLRAADVPSSPPRIAFLFPGQGSQSVNMGLGLYRTLPVFRDTVDLCCRQLQPHLDFDLRSVLYPASGQEAEAERLLSQTKITQPAIFVIEYALAMLWKDMGIVPSVMAGHSIGEYVAACLAGVFSLEDALALVAARGRLIQSMPAGAMLAVHLSVQDLEPLLSADVSIAAVNSPDQTVASGPEPAIAALEEALRGRKLESRRLRTSHAFHSSMMEPMLAEFMQLVAKVPLQPPAVPYLSNVSGTWITPQQVTDPSYWAQHVRSAVRFSDNARKLLDSPDNVFLEVGPGETLLGLMRAQLEPRTNRTLLASMRHAMATREDRDTWLEAVGRLWLAGGPIQWDGLYRGQRRLRLSLPTYPFERQKYWLEPKSTAAVPTSEPSTAPGKQPDMADWFYVPSWKRTAAGLRPRPATAAAPACLFFGDESPLSAALVSRLTPIGKWIHVRAGKKFHQISSGLYEMDLEDANEYPRLLQALEDDGCWPDRVIYPQDELASPGVGLAPNPAAALERELLRILFLVQAIEDRSSTKPVELNLIGERAYSVFGEPVSSPAVAALNTFCTVVALECPNITCRILDVDLQAGQERVLSQSAQELDSEAANEIVAWRGSARWVQQLEPARLEDSGAVAAGATLGLRQSGVYLITGGLGGIGLVLARHLARTVQAHIVLTSRTLLPPPSEWQTRIASPETPGLLRRRLQDLLAIEQAGGTVLVLQADTLDSGAMRHALATARARYGAVHGIIHAAGVAGAGLVRMKSADQVRAVLAPKVQGVEWIRESLAGNHLDFVLLCSSISAAIPSMGLSDYAAANAYLDAFACLYDNPRGTRVLSAGWDTWREVGMAVDTQVPAALAAIRDANLEHGILSSEAEQVFDRLLQFAQPHVVVSTRNWTALEKRAAQAMAAMRAAAGSAAVAVAAQGTPDWEIASASTQEDVERSIVQIWQELLGVDPIGPNDNFFQLGGHSLLGTQVLARLRERFHVDLSLRAVFEAPTPAELAQHVHAGMWAAKPASNGLETEREEIEI